MKLARRQEQILELVRMEGFVGVEALASHFEVTQQTIRRDINGLTKTGLVRRYHGGAGLPSSVENLDYTARQVLNLEEKRRIGALVADFIPDGASLIINLGTTNEEVAKRLSDRHGLRVITNNLNVATIMGRSRDNQIFITPGAVRARDLGVTGEATIDFISQFRVDFGIIGISGIDEDGTLRDYDFKEIQVSKAVIRQSRKVLLVADHSKFGRQALVALGPIGLVDRLFTDVAPSAAMMEILGDSGVVVDVAGGRSARADRRDRQGADQPEGPEFSHGRNPFGGGTVPGEP